MNCCYRSLKKKKKIQNRGPLPETEAIGFFVDIVSAVDYIHRKGVVHRDLVKKKRA